MFESELNADLSPTMGYRLHDVCAIVFAHCCKNTWRIGVHHNEIIRNFALRE